MPAGMDTMLVLLSLAVHRLPLGCGYGIPWAAHLGHAVRVDLRGAYQVPGNQLLQLGQVRVNLAWVNRAWVNIGTTKLHCVIQGSTCGHCATCASIGASTSPFED